MISTGRTSITLDDIYNVTSEAEIASHYLGITSIPCKINSPLRRDNNPSFGIFSPDGIRVTYVDFSTNERGGIIGLLSQMWHVPFDEALRKIYNEFHSFKGSTNIRKVDRRMSVSKGNNDVTLECKTREWKQHDIDYWKSFGITLEWLKYADVYPISHKIIVKNGQRFVFGADTYAYAYVEFKGGKTTLKIYQPFNKKGFKWANKHDRSVISLWTKVPKEGERIVICSSLKDALCLWANTGIPAIAIQGEGYGISDTAVSELKRRYKEIYILLDNDEAGLNDGEKLSKSTGFTNIVLPKINNTKDISDLYKSLKNKKEFKSIIYKLFNSK